MAITDDPSIPGFVAYKLSGNKLKSEREAEDKAKKEKERKPNPVTDRAGYIDAAERKALEGNKKGGCIKAKKYARGGGIEKRGKTRGRFV